MTKRHFFISTAVIAALLAGCGGSSSTDTTEKVADTTQSVAEFDDDDVMFAQMMIPHHEQAIEMSDIALDPAVGASDVVKSLATRIKGAQDPEIATMTGFLTSWGKSLEMDSSMDHGSMMSGMLSTEELATLGTLRSAEFDTAWMKAMIKHHEGAIEMANDVIDDGKNAAVRTLAEKIVSAQDAEISEMKALVG